MPLIMGTTTIGAAATQLTTTKTPVTFIRFTAPAAAVTYGTSGVTTSTGITIAGAANDSYGGSPQVFDLTEIWVTGTQNQVLRWVATTL